MVIEPCSLLLHLSLVARLGVAMVLRWGEDKRGFVLELVRNQGGERTWAIHAVRSGTCCGKSSICQIRVAGTAIFGIVPRRVQRDPKV